MRYKVITNHLRIFFNTGCTDKILALKIIKYITKLNVVDMYDNTYGTSLLMDFCIYASVPNININNILATKIYKTIIDTGVDINLQDENKQTALIKIAQCSHCFSVYIIKSLLQLGADPYIIDNCNWSIFTYMHRSANPKRNEINKLLISYIHK